MRRSIAAGMCARIAQSMTTAPFPCSSTFSGWRVEVDDLRAMSTRIVVPVARSSTRSVPRALTTSGAG